MILRIKNTSPGNISLPLGPTLRPGEGADMEMNYSVSQLVWAVREMGLDIEAIGGVTKEIHNQYDMQVVVLDLCLRGLIWYRITYGT